MASTATSVTNMMRQLKTEAAVLGFNPKNTFEVLQKVQDPKDELGAKIRQRMIGVFDQKFAEEVAEIRAAGETVTDAMASGKLSVRAKNFAPTMELLQLGPNRTKQLMETARTDINLGNTAESRQAMEARFRKRLAAVDATEAAQVETTEALLNDLKADMRGGVQATREQLIKFMEDLGKDNPALGRSFIDFAKQKVMEVKTFNADSIPDLLNEMKLLAQKEAIRAAGPRTEVLEGNRFAGVGAPGVVARDATLQEARGFAGEGNSRQQLATRAFLQFADALDRNTAAMEKFNGQRKTPPAGEARAREAGDQ